MVFLTLLEAKFFYTLCHYSFGLKGKCYTASFLFNEHQFYFYSKKLNQEIELIKEIITSLEKKGIIKLKHQIFIHPETKVKHPWFSGQIQKNFIKNNRVDFSKFIVQTNCLIPEEIEQIFKVEFKQNKNFKNRNRYFLNSNHFNHYQKI